MKHALSYTLTVLSEQAHKRKAEYIPKGSRKDDYNAGYVEGIKQATWIVKDIINENGYRGKPNSMGMVKLFQRRLRVERGYQRSSQRLIQLHKRQATEIDSHGREIRN